jgi:hypothetical protein
MASSLTPDITRRVLPADYEQALAVDGQRWEDHHSPRRPAWAGRHVWTLCKGTEERTFWRLFAFGAEHDYQASEQSAMTAIVAGLVTGCSFRSADAMATIVCERLVQELRRALSSEEHARVLTACAELWEIANPVVIETYELTAAGSAALAPAERPAVGTRVVVVSGPDLDAVGTVEGERDRMLRVRLDRFPASPYWFLPAEIEAAR